ncbi:MAG: hypothetical protein PVJ01_05315 [Pseudomonadota bacterium]|jgi:hypothetical protein
MPKQIKIPPVVLFFLPIFISLGLFISLYVSCEAEKGTPGSITLLYTSEVGGRIDPCG